MTRVLLVGKGAPDRGGIPSFLAMLLRGDLAAEHDIDFLNVAHTGTPEGGRLTLGNVRRTVSDALAVLRSARRYDVVHLHTALVPTVTLVRAGMLLLAARVAGARTIVHVHGGNLAEWLRPLPHQLLLRVALRPAYRVVAVWSAGHKALRHVLGDGRVHLMDNGVNVELGRITQPGSRRVPRILYVGLLTPRKGVLDLLAACDHLTARGVEHELWLLGGTPDEGPHAERAIRRALPATVRLLDTRPPEEMPAAYAEADVFVLPSWWEAMPLSVLEAMAAGLPVVATDVGDVARAVNDGVTGRVVPPRAPDALAEALEALVRDPDLRQRMGSAGKDRARQMFNSANTLTALSELYRETARGPRR